MDLKNKFQNFNGNDKYQRVGIPHPLPWYIGLDTSSRYSLFCITDTQPQEVSSTKLISVFVGKRGDEKFGVTFSLQDKEAFDMFIHFCEDMVDSSRNCNEALAADYICARYLIWQRAFSLTAGKLLSYEQVKGLLGELCFLTMKMIPEFGVDKALKSWSGIETTDQDFTCDETWFEIKATVSGSSSIKISSIQQLDVETNGFLVVVRLDKTSEGNSCRMTLNSMYHRVLDTFSSPLHREQFISRMIKFGYYEDKGYEKYGFKFSGMSLYRVNSSFPCIRKKDLPVAVEHVKYELSLAAIEEFKEN